MKTFIFCFDSFPFSEASKLKLRTSLLKSVVPPITCPALITALTGKDPGELGIYGIRKRVGNNFSLISRNDLKTPLITDELTKKGFKVFSLGIPFEIFEDTKWKLTFPSFLSGKEEKKLNDYSYFPDVDFSSSDIDFIDSFEKVFDNHCKLIFDNFRYDVYICELIEVDRFLHKFRGDTQKEEYLINKLNDLIENIGNDNRIICFSDHGMKVRRRVVNSNWNENLSLLVNGIGGYCPRIWFSVRGKSVHGVLKVQEYFAFRKKVEREIKNTFPEAVFFYPEVEYRMVKGNFPDLMFSVEDFATQVLFGEEERDIRGVHDFDGFIGTNFDTRLPSNIIEVRDFLMESVVL